jgi:hypothetical protein
MLVLYGLGKRSTCLFIQYSRKFFVFGARVIMYGSNTVSVCGANTYIEHCNSHLSSAEIKESRAIHLLRLWVFMTCCTVNFIFTFNHFPGFKFLDVPSFCTYLFTVCTCLCNICTCLCTVCSACVLFVRACVLYVRAFVLFVRACVLFVRACVLFVRDCVLFVRACVLFVRVCVLFVRACVLFVRACLLFVRACVLCVRACVLFVRACVLFVLLATSVLYFTSYNMRVLLYIVLINSEIFIVGIQF